MNITTCPGAHTTHTPCQGVIGSGLWAHCLELAKRISDSESSGMLWEIMSLESQRGQRDQDQEPGSKSGTRESYSSHGLSPATCRPCPHTLLLLCCQRISLYIEGTFPTYDVCLQNEPLVHFWTAIQALALLLTNRRLFLVYEPQRGMVCIDLLWILIAKTEEGMVKMMTEEMTLTSA